MPTVLRERGLEIMIYIRDHAPAHVHVFSGGAEMVIEIETDLRIRDNWGFNRRDQAIAKLIVSHNVEFLRLEWRRIHG